MAFEPDFSVCIKNKCKSIVPTDITDVYHVTTNPTGWGNALTVAASEIDSATFVILTSADSTITTTVTTQVPDPVIGDFTFSAIENSGAVFPDGETKFTYTIIVVSGNNPGTYIKTKCVYLTCNIECYVNSLWVAVAEGGCNCGCNLDTLIEEALIAEGLLSALKSSAASNDITTADLILQKLQDLETLNNCNCS